MLDDRQPASLNLSKGWRKQCDRTQYQQRVRKVAKSKNADGGDITPKRSGKLTQGRQDFDVGLRLSRNILQHEQHDQDSDRAGNEGNEENVS